MTRARCLVVLLVLLTLTCHNLPPRDPAAPEGYEAARTGISYNYTTTGRDLDEGDQVAVQFDWGDGTQTEWSELKESGATFSADHAWQAEGEYYVTARARDQRGSVSDWSLPLGVVVEDDANNAPGIPALLPVTDSVYLGTVNEFRVCVTDPENDALRFQFAWEAGEDSRWSEWLSGGDTLNCSTRVIGRTTPARVRVRSQDEGYTSQWSNWFSIPVHREGTVKWGIEVWRADGSYPAIGTDGTVYLPTQDRGLLALDPQDGSVRWQDGHNACSSPVIGGDGIVYYSGRPVPYGPVTLSAIDADRSARWRFEPGFAVDRLTLAGDGTLIAADVAGNVMAFDQDSVPLWTAALGASMHTPPVIGTDGTVFARGDHERILALDPANGEILWSSEEHRMYGVMNLAVGHDGTLYVLGGRDIACLLALDPTTGSEKWTYHTGTSVGTGAVVGSDGSVYVPSDNHVTRLSPSGEVLWRHDEPDLEGYVSSLALCEDGSILWACEDELQALEPDGSLRWGTTLGLSWYPFTCPGPDGTVYVLSEDTLFAIHGPSPLADSPWPKFQRDLGNTGRAGP
ncbi:PQQ-like beta-propeller repeat protein [candidate division WOR-3 bacterium]|nr:PQQ-like beta-propeller repeat protein [candidate division WOR-3 bacterium]